MAVPASPVVLGDSQPWIEWSWVGRHGSEIWGHVVTHIELTLVAVGIGFVLSVPLALVAWRWRRWEKPVYGLTGLLFTIPSLALFAILIPVFGIGRTTAEIGLVSYTLLILVRNIVTGLDSVPAEVRDAARGLGYGRFRQLVTVELPLASPAIIAGIRLAVVTIVGLVAVADLVGAGGGLGVLISEGQQNNFRTEIVVGAVLSVVLAATLDAGLLLIQRLVTPWTRRGRSG